MAAHRSALLSGPPAAALPPLLMLDSHLESAGAARRHACAYVREHTPDVPDDALADTILIVSELVANAVQHATGPGDSVQLKLAAKAGRIRVEVDDPCHTQPRRQQEPEDHGRGLLILDRLASRWGIDDRTTSKTVWAEVAW